MSCSTESLFLSSSLTLMLILEDVLCSIGSSTCTLDKRWSLISWWNDLKHLRSNYNLSGAMNSRFPQHMRWEVYQLPRRSFILPWIGLFTRKSSIKSINCVYWFQIWYQSSSWNLLCYVLGINNFAEPRLSWNALSTWSARRISDLILSSNDTASLYKRHRKFSRDQAMVAVSDCFCACDFDHLFSNYEALDADKVRFLTWKQIFFLSFWF